jgi:hypothetical protein
MNDPAKYAEYRPYTLTDAEGRRCSPSVTARRRSGSSAMA